MGFIEGILGERSEEKRRMAQEEQKKVEALVRDNKTNLPLRRRAQDYFFESICPKVIADFRKIEPRSQLNINSGFKWHEWKAKGGVTFKEMFFLEEVAVNSSGRGDYWYAPLDNSIIRPLSTLIEARLNWRCETHPIINQSHSYISMSCDSEGVLKIGSSYDIGISDRGGKFEYQTWRNNPDIQEEAFKRAYKHPDYHGYTGRSGPGFD
jgi:hypothetical protein